MKVEGGQSGFVSLLNISYIKLVLPRRIQYIPLGNILQPSLRTSPIRCEFERSVVPAYQKSNPLNAGPAAHLQPAPLMPREEDVCFHWLDHSVITMGGQRVPINQVGRWP
jgi:hypothetical protein